MGDFVRVFQAGAWRGLGPSGGFFLVPPRKKERMRLKEALTAACSRRRAALLKNSSGALLRKLGKMFRLELRGIYGRTVICRTGY